ASVSVSMAKVCGGAPGRSSVMRCECAGVGSSLPQAERRAEASSRTTQERSKAIPRELRADRADHKRERRISASLRAFSGRARDDPVEFAVEGPLGFEQFIIVLKAEEKPF